MATPACRPQPGQLALRVDVRGVRNELTMEVRPMTVVPDGLWEDRLEMGNRPLDKGGVGDGRDELAEGDRRGDGVLRLEEGGVAVDGRESVGHVCFEWWEEERGFAGNQAVINTAEPRHGTLPTTAVQLAHRSHI